MSKQNQIHCAGVVVLYRDNDDTYTVIVSTPKGNHGFPKGKREKGESIQAAALRETFEETGINQSDITIVSEETIVDGSTLYYVGTTQIKHVLVLAEKEHATVEWTTIPDALIKLRASRIEVLNKAIQIYNSTING